MRKNQSIAGHMAVCEVTHTMSRAAAGTCLFVACLVLFSSSPRAQVPKTDPLPYAAPPGKALLVFHRPRKRQASETEFRIVDQAGRCLGILKNGWLVAAAVYPGSQMIMVLTGTAQTTVQLLQAKVSGGKTYVVELGARVNVKSPAEITVVRRDDQPLNAFPPAIKEQSPFPYDLRKCTEWVSWKRARIEPKAEIAKNKWDEADDDVREANTIHRNDGWTEAEIYGP